jgi:hypothetical protein
MSGNPLNLRISLILPIIKKFIATKVSRKPFNQIILIENLISTTKILTQHIKSINHVEFLSTKMLLLSRKINSPKKYNLKQNKKAMPANKRHNKIL